MLNIICMRMFANNIWTSSRQKSYFLSFGSFVNPFKTIIFNENNSKIRSKNARITFFLKLFNFQTNRIFMFARMTLFFLVEFLNIRINRQFVFRIVVQSNRSNFQVKIWPDISGILCKNDVFASALLCADFHTLRHRFGMSDVHASYIWLFESIFDDLRQRDSVIFFCIFFDYALLVLLFFSFLFWVLVDACAKNRNQQMLWSLASQERYY